ncbi:hypothetical protein CsatA_015159 [Cannabis sativa]|uniref:Uncharacterized protein n=1 Tax=Cannabis sativa TaxID=3483 RepID=A0A803QNU1_CANSA
MDQENNFGANKNPKEKQPQDDDHECSDCMMMNELIEDMKLNSADKLLEYQFKVRDLELHMFKAEKKLAKVDKLLEIIAKKNEVVIMFYEFISVK